MVLIPKTHLYYIWIALIFAILLLSGCSGFSGAPDKPRHPAPEAVQGTIDLRDWDFAGAGIVPLSGEWDFYWDRLLGPEEAAPLSAGGAGREWIPLPRSWNGYRPAGQAQALSGSGSATFHLRVLLDTRSGVLALELPVVRTAFKLWVNGKQLAQAGTVGASADTAKPGYRPQIVYFPQEGVTALDIVLQVSNFDHRLGGVWRELRLGEAGQLSAGHNRHLALEMSLGGGFFLMGCYHFVLFLFRIRERASLYFGLFCLIAALRALFIGQEAIYQLFPGIPWQAGLRMEYICFYSSLPIGVLFFRSLYPHELGQRTVRVIQWFGCLCLVTVVLLPSRIYTWTLLAYQVLIVLIGLILLGSLIKARFRQRDRAAFALIGYIVFTTTIFADIAQLNGWISAGGYSSFGFFFLILMTSLIISMKSFKAFAAVESLSFQLRELNMGLEQRIRERTSELEKSNRRLEKMNEDLGRLETSRRHLLSNISHDLGTPMTLIQGYVEALIDQVVTDPKQQHNYLRLILNRINGLNRLIADLFQLSKLEARQIHFSMRAMPIGEFVDYYGERYGLEVKNAGIGFRLDASILPRMEPPDAAVIIDLDRIDQVLTNIVYNATKHTPKDGLIRLQFVLDSTTMMVRVHDNGEGIDPEDLPYIFDRFYKKSKSRNTSEGGSGLGLAIAKEIIDFHGGRIWAESRVGQGACLSFALPLHNVQPAPGDGVRA
ncbi:ATP-binding protein [Paenibacillus piri]|uniref:sensor histidine kinase n=1 Tax=Paenibacillus piri TaxID=2547395 RepID=UPI001FE83C46|nr:ATP-binding protein [Paenibacillus piri]